MQAVAIMIAGVGAYSSAQYQSAIATQQAQIAEYNAKLATEIGQRDAVDIATENIGLMGEQTSAQGASGIEINSESFVNSRIRTAELAWEDQKRTIEKSNRQSANFKNEAETRRVEAKAKKVESKLALASAAFSATGSFISESTGYGGGGFSA